MLLHTQRAAALMAEAKLDALVAATQENVVYTTGIWNVNMSVLPRLVQCYAILPRDRLGSPSVVMGVGDADQYLTAFPDVGPLYCFGTFYREVPEPDRLNARERRLKTLTVDSPSHGTATDALVSAVEELGLTSARIGVDEEGMDAAGREVAAARLPAARLVNASALLRKIRMVKTPTEVERLRRAQAACEAGITAVRAMVHPGVTEREMTGAYTAGVAAAGGRVTFALIRVGRNGALGQLPPEETALAKGDSVWFDVGAVVDGYHADLARILVLGDPSTKMRRYYAAALAGEEHAFAITRPGITASQLFQQTVDAVRRSGIPHYRRHHVGHGIGVEVYDPPVLTAAADLPIETGMVINIETPYYELGWAAVHVEDPYLVRANGSNEWLTTLSRDLLIVE